MFDKKCWYKKPWENVTEDDFKLCQFSAFFPLNSLSIVSAPMNLATHPKWLKFYEHTQLSGTPSSTWEPAIGFDFLFKKDSV